MTNEFQTWARAQSPDWHRGFNAYHSGNWCLLQKSDSYKKGWAFARCYPTIKIL
jgi:hypothetical protein